MLPAMSAPSENQSSRRPAFVAGIAIGLLTGILMTVIVVGTLVVLEDNSTTVPDQSPAPPASQSPTPSPAASLERQVEGSFHDQEWLKGDGLWIWVSPFGLRDPGCVVHAFAKGHGTLGAYLSGCLSWERDGYDILMFYVALRNPTRRSVSFSLRNFILTARDRRTFGSVNVRSEAEFPPHFLPEKAKIPPRSNLVGWLTFDGRVRGLVAAELNYVNGPQTLTVVFEGQHTVR